METNSRHHQAVTRDGIAPGLIPTAYSPDGLVEAMEHPGSRWVLGVQWHPERDEVKAAFRALFDDFVAQAARTSVSVPAN
jgi:putative glutamine amidotransferase